MSLQNIDDLMVALAASFPRDFEKPGQLAELSRHYRAALGRTAPRELDSAWLRTMSNWEKSRRPYPSEIAANFPKTLTGRTEQLDEYEAWADQILRSPTGRKACQDGYARELYLWAKANVGKAPRDEDILWCAEQTVRFRSRLGALAELAKKTQPGSQWHSLARITVLNAGSAMVNFEYNLKRKYWPDWQEPQAVETAF